MLSISSRFDSLGRRIKMQKESKKIYVSKGGDNRHRGTEFFKPLRTIRKAIEKTEINYYKPIS